MVPMSTRDSKLEPDDWILSVMHLDVLHSRLKGTPPDAMIALWISIYLHSLTCVIHAEFLPGEHPPVFAEEVFPVLGIMSGSEVNVAHGKLCSRKMSVVDVARAAKTASAPASVNELPLSIVDAHGVPCVVALERWNWVARLERRVAKAFPHSTHDNSLKASFQGQSSKETRVAFADGQTRRYGPLGCGWRDVTREEGVTVIVDIMVKPGEDSACLVCGGRE